MLSHCQHQYPLRALARPTRPRPGIPFSTPVCLVTRPARNATSNSAATSSARGQSPRLKKNIPPVAALFLQPRSNLLPHAPPVLFAGIRNRQRLERRQHPRDALQLRAAFAALRDVRREFLAARSLAILVRD